MNELIYLTKFSETSERWIDGNKMWVQLYPYDTWDHPIYGSTTVDNDVARQMTMNFHNKVRGQEIHSDYEHGQDSAKGNKASGKFVEVEPRDDGLWGLIQFTDEARKEIDAGEWNYWSTAHYETWTHPQTNASYRYVLDGGGLTNKPWIKGMVPLNFSEVFVEESDVDEDGLLREFKDPKKPYGNVTYADPGYQSDKKKRYPLDTETHIRAAWSYINMPKNAKKYTSDQLSKIKARIRAAMKRIGATLRENAELMELAIEVMDEHADLETHDPGLPPDPKTNEDDSAEGGWRRDTPPAGEDGTVPDRSKTVTSEGGEMELEQQLREALNLDENADIVKAITDMRDEVEPLREVARKHAEKRRFSEEFPVEFERMQRLEKDNRENFAKSFSESLAASRVVEKDGDNDKPTTVGLSALAIEKGREVALKFSEGSITFADFKEFTDAVFNNGLVDYGVVGSSQETDGDEIPVGDVRRFSEVPSSGQEARKLFAEAVSHYQNELTENDKLDPNKAYRQAISVAAEKHPKLYEAYMRPVTAR